MRTMNWMKSNHTSVKRNNRRLILEVIRSQTAISRADISRLTELTKATVSTLTEELLQEGLIQEIGHDTVSPQVGRKPVLLSFVDFAGYVLGIELAVDCTRIVAMDLAYRMLGEKIITASYATADELVLLVHRAAMELISGIETQSPGLTRYGLVRVGVGVAGFVNFETGTVIKTPNMPLSGTEIRKLLEHAFATPVLVDNEANTAAFGERLCGDATDADHLVYVSAGPGIGVGCVLDGQLYRGYSGMAGELGHMTVLPTGLLCGCGNYGCWEMYASEKFLRRELSELYDASTSATASVTPDGESISPDFIQFVASEASHQNERVLSTLQTLGEWLGLGFANIANTFNPRSIVLGNTLTTLAEWLIPTIQLVIRRRCLAQVADALSIHTSHAGSQAVVNGAAALAVMDFIEKI